MVSSDPSIPAGCIELVLHKKNYGVVLYELELHLNRLTHLPGAGQAGDVQVTTCNCYLAVISTVFVNHMPCSYALSSFIALKSVFRPSSASVIS